MLFPAVTQAYEDRFRSASDWLAIAVAASLPWSTSATGVLVGLWLVVTLPILDLEALRRIARHPAAAFPIVLFGLAALGILWSEAPWKAAFQGFSQFWKLLLIPLLFAHFQKSDRGFHVAAAFLASCTLLLAVSFLLVTSGWRANLDGIPVKDRIVQSGEFVLCAFGCLYLATDMFSKGRRLGAAALTVLAVLFLANVFYVATSRTSLVVIPVLLLFFGFRLFGWKGTVAFATLGVLAGALLWVSSPHLRQRVMDVTSELQAYEIHRQATSSGLRIDYWTKSIAFIRDAPIIGHGSGTIRQLFERATDGAGQGWTTANPHNQTLAVGIQLGFVGIALLVGLWMAHFLFFRPRAGFAAWLGEMVVVQNIVSSLFNSHLFDFTQGWIYVFGVGVAGAMILRTGQESGAKGERPL